MICDKVEECARNLHHLPVTDDNGKKKRKNNHHDKSRKEDA